MKNYLHSNRVTVFIVILAIGSISGVVSAQFVMGLDSNIVKNLVKNQGTSVNDKISKIISSIKKSVGIGEETGRLIVLGLCKAGETTCINENFRITIKGNNPSPDSFILTRHVDHPTEVILGKGNYTIIETPLKFPTAHWAPRFLGDCKKIQGEVFEASGFMDPGSIPKNLQQCYILNQIT